ncbi:hypothetical protein IQ06DRAFT_366265 [Phaeosphaeriaceae sp. SRC1lsM3a]|nr:hypothetical protein IQ06DRAFT_366265 [Stagonospora sp. SRC1lsM3a]
MHLALFSEESVGTMCWKQKASLAESTLADRTHYVVPPVVFVANTICWLITGTQGYRAEAAAAKFSRLVAAQYYDLDRAAYVYGYIYGASGGSLQVIGALENTAGIWDGGVPIVQANTASVSISQTDIASAIVVLDGCGPNLRQGFLDKKNTSGSEQSALGDVFRTAVVEFSATVIEVTRNARVDLGWGAKGYLFGVTATNGTDLGGLGSRFDLTTSIADLSAPESDTNNVPLYPFFAA